MNFQAMAVHYSRGWELNKIGLLPLSLESQSIIPIEITSYLQKRHCSQQNFDRLPSSLPAASHKQQTQSTNCRQNLDQSLLETRRAEPPYLQQAWHFSAGTLRTSAKSHAGNRDSRPTRQGHLWHGKTPQTFFKARQGIPCCQNSPNGRRISR